jgi:hypothetical protein
MDPLHFCIAVAPLSVYFLLFGIINLKRRPFVTTGARDTAALAIGISGLIVAGPMELFFPEAAASRWGGLVWIVLIAFYGLCVSLLVLLMRPRIVVYNIGKEELRAILNQVGVKLDKKSRWVGDSLMLPDSNVHLNMESQDWLRNVQLTAGGSRQNLDCWRAIEMELKSAVDPLRVNRNPIGLGMILVSAALAVITAVWMVAEKLAVAQALNELLRQ